MEQYWSSMRGGDPRRRQRSKRWTDSCRPSAGLASRDGNDDGDDDDDNNSNIYDDDEAGRGSQQAVPGPGNFVWTETLKQSFREQLEKLVILDYIMRNTDRGLDNWMIKVDWQTEQATIASDPIQMSLQTDEEGEDQGQGPRLVDVSSRFDSSKTASLPYRVQRPMKASSPSHAGQTPAISIGAIDNSLSWPWKHPDGWRRWAQSSESGG